MRIKSNKHQKRNILQVHPNVICKGRRSFNRRVRCNWSSGISWAKAMFLSVTLGLGIWTIVDVVLIATGYIRPADGSLYI
ncbi:hypothetical protein COOONC_21003 [Cooperia oncophora]